MKPRYELCKMSSPGWIFQSNHIKHIRWMLDQHICNNCKWTRKDYDDYVKSVGGIEDKEIEEECLDTDRNPYTFTDFFPEDTSKMSDIDMIYLLLSTACGCEYDFVDAEDPETGKQFVEINNG